MSKKKKIEISEDDFEEKEIVEEKKENEEIDDPDLIEDENSFSSDEDEVDIIIEISDDDLDLSLDIKEEIKENDTSEAIDDIILSKHQMEGKHSLKYDSIFKGKKEEKLEEDDNTFGYFNEKFEVDKSSFFYTESFENEQYNRSKSLKEKVYGVLSDHTSINFLNNRRKPSKVDFNNYYALLKQERSQEKKGKIYENSMDLFINNFYNICK